VADRLDAPLPADVRALVEELEDVAANDGNTTAHHRDVLTRAAAALRRLAADAERYQTLRRCFVADVTFDPTEDQWVAKLRVGARLPAKLVDSAKIDRNVMFALQFDKVADDAARRGQEGTE